MISTIGQLSSSGKYVWFGLRIETRTHDVDNLQHDPESTRHRYSPESRRRAVEDNSRK